MAYAPIDGLSTERLGETLRGLVTDVMRAAERMGARPVGLEVRAVAAAPEATAYTRDQLAAAVDACAADDPEAQAIARPARPVRVALHDGFLQLVLDREAQIRAEESPEPLYMPAVGGIRYRSVGEAVDAVASIVARILASLPVDAAAVIPPVPEPVPEPAVLKARFEVEMPRDPTTADLADGLKLIADAARTCEQTARGRPAVNERRLLGLALEFFHQWDPDESRNDAKRAGTAFGAAMIDAGLLDEICEPTPAGEALREEARRS